MTGVREVATDDRDAGAPEAGLLVEGLTVVTEGRQTPVVQDVGFAVAPGHVMGLVGESGSGKSTIGVALLGLARRGLRIAGGRVCIDGVDILGLQGRNLQNARGRLIAYVPQDPVSGLNPALTVGRQLREAIIIHRDTLPAGETIEQRVHQLMDEVGLPSTDAFLNSYPHQMSGGQQQRVGIAMAFSCRPRVIVLDEPTTGLDVTTQRRVLETVRELTAEHQVTSVYVSHDLAVVAQLADQTAVLYAGRVVEHAATESMFGGARHPYTVGLLKAVPSSARSEILVGIEGRPPRPGRWPQGCLFADRCESVQQTCREELPPLRNLGDSGQSHLARCYFPQPPVSADHAKNPVPTLSGGPLPIVTVRKLAARYGAREVLRDVSFEVLAGRCTAVVGQSGSGKTTLARSLVGLHTAWTGEVEFAGTRLDTQPQRRTKAQRQTLQYVFQNPYSSLNPRMSVRENLEEPLRYFSSLSHRQRTEKVFGVLATVALSEEYAERMPQQLSGGERQRVAVGRALIVDPDVIVCDEITSALDVSVQALLVEQLRRLQNERGLSLVFITHNLAVVRSIAQEVVVLSDGVIVESGSVDRVLDHPTHAYTQSLLADLPSTERS